VRRLAGAELQALSARLRGLVLRQAKDTRAHIGSALSVIEILACLYFHHLDMGPAVWERRDRDRLILSKGHGALALYAVLCEAGFLPIEMLERYGAPDCPLGGHPSSKTPGVELGTGALGHGLAVGAGMAIAARIDGSSARVAVVMGDGELDEGSVWEAAMFCSHQRLGNLVAVVDRNRLQQEGPTETVLALEPLADKWRAFGWNVVTVNGHDIDQLTESLDAIDPTAGRPTILIGETVKGRGVSFMEGEPAWHMALLESPKFDRALAEVEGRA
jgi:transketolase